MHGEIMPAWGKSATPNAAFLRCKSGDFGDVDFSATDQKGSVSGFNLGQFVLHLASPLSDKVSYFGEISFTAQPTGYDLSVERTSFATTTTTTSKSHSANITHPIGYWNATFHHGAWLQTTIARPEMVQLAERLSRCTLSVCRPKAIFPREGWAWATTWASEMDARRF